MSVESSGEAGRVEISGAAGRSASDVDAANPWPGLAPYTEDQSGLFHGRDAEIRALARLMERKALTVLFGQSGLGKSSLLMAGVFPRLRANSFCPIYVRLDHGSGAPSLTEQVKAIVSTATAAAGRWTRPGAAGPGETLWEFFHHRDDRLIDAGGRTIVPVLVFDQFEELFTLGAAARSTSSGSGTGASRDRAIAFMSELAELVENRPSEQLVARLEHSAAEMDAFDFGRTDYRVCIALREDYLPHLEGLKTIMPALMENRMRLARMTGVQALEAVVKPGGALVTPEVAHAIVEFVSGARGGSVERLAEVDVEPPLLSVICRELNERRRALGQAQITVDLVTGNRREILTDFYERSVADLPEGMRTFVEDHLLTKSGFRDNFALETALETPGVTRSLIDVLVLRRLLRIEEHLGLPRVELSHDVLAEVVRASRDARQQRIELAAAARHTHRQRWAIAGLSAAVIALGIGVVVGIRVQQRSTQQSGHTDVVLGSRLLDEGKLSEGLAYLVRAGRKDSANELIAPRLLSALSARSFLLPTGSPFSVPGPTYVAAYTADDRWIFVQGEDDVVRIIDATEWRIVRELNFEQKIRKRGIALAEKNSAVFAVILTDDTILVCDTATGLPKGRPIRPPDRIIYRLPIFHFSPDGRWIAAAGPTDVWLWDANTGELQATLPANGWRDFAFSPDSQRLARTHDQKTTMWSIPDGALIGTAVDSTPSSAVPIFSGDGSLLFVWNNQGVLVCDASTGALLRPLIPISSQTTNGVWVTRDGKKLIYTTTARTAHVLDVETGKPLLPPLLHGGNTPWIATRLVADDKVLFTNSVDGVQRFWDLETGRLLAEPTLRQPQFATAAVSSDGRQVVLFSAAGPVYRLRVGGRPAAPLALLRTPKETLMVNFAPGSPSRVRWLTYSAASEIDVASGGKTDGGFTFPEPLTNASRSPYGGTLSSGEIVIVQTRSRGHRVWTVGEKGIASDVALENAPPNATTGSFGLDSSLQRVARSLGSGGDDGTKLGVWDARTGRLSATINASGANLGYVYTVFSPDGRRVTYRTTDGTIHVCDLATGREVFALELTGKAVIRSLRFSPDGKRILTGDTWGGIQIWDADTGRQLRSTQYHRIAVTRFDYSSDKRFYASLSSDGSVQVWDAATDQPVGALLELAGSAMRADFSPDNSRIITPSSGGTARVWDVRTGLPVTDVMDTEGDATTVVAFSPDGRFVDVHGGTQLARQFVRFWSVPPASAGARTPEWLLALATICAGHRLTDEGKLVDATGELAKMEDVQRALAAAPANDLFAEWGRWILSDSPTRSIAPGFTITPAKAAKFKAEWLKE